MAGNGKKVLLHACCGPCSIMCIQSLRDEGYDVTGYFANPNIHPVSEYFRRREAMEQVAEQMDLPMLWQDDVYDLPGWLKIRLLYHKPVVFPAPAARRHPGNRNPRRGVR